MDKLRELTPIPITFFSGERPTDEKLEGMMKQVETAFDFVELSLGDLYGDSPSPALWTTNIGRDLGDRSKLNPLIQPDVFLENYAQELEAGLMEHELDLVPVGAGAALLVASNDSSVVPSQFKSTESELEEPGDWTIRPGKIENGIEKNSRKLITHAPSIGGTITFALMTSGKGSTFHGSTHNLIPSIAQAEAGGPFCDVVLSNVNDNIYTFTLPVDERQFNELNDSALTSISNTDPSVGNGQQLVLPSYLFDPNGLDLLSEDAFGNPKKIPLSSIQIWDWDAKRMVEGVEEITCSANFATRRFQFTVKIRPDVLLDIPLGRYLVSTSGTSVYDMLGALQRELIFHRHDGDDQVRHISHSSLMGLRSGSPNPADRSSYYGPSNIDNNDHSMYFHRSGYAPADIGGGGNIIRGDVVVGSTVTGPAAEHENHNLLEDSRKIAFGRIDNGGEIYFDKIRVQNLPEGRGNIPQNYSDTAIVIKGSQNDIDPALFTSLFDGTLRVTKDVVLGTTADDDVFISGDLYVHQSATLTPKTNLELSSILAETGKIVYSISQNAPVYWNGNAWINIASAGYSAIVGDGVNSFGKFNGNGSSAIQAAVNEVNSNGGGKILVLRGTYNFGATPVNVSSNVQIEGEGHSTSVTATGAAFNLPVGTSRSSVKNIRIAAAFGLDVSGTNNTFDNLDLEGSTEGYIQRASAHSNYFGLLKLNSYLNESLDPRSSEAANNAVGFATNFKAVDWSNKRSALSKIKRTSGSGQLSFEDTNDCATGRGRYAITGTGTWIVESFIPVLPFLGVGGSISHKASANGGALTVGVQCFDSDYNSLGNNGGYLINSGASTTDWQLKYGYARTEQNSGVQNLRVGTKFVKILISVTSNPGTIYLDALDAAPMGFAAFALYF